MDHILGIKEALLTKIELGVGGYQCLMGSVQSTTRTYTMFNDNLSRGVYFTNLLDK